MTKLQPGAYFVPNHNISALADELRRDKNAPRLSCEADALAEVCDEHARAVGEAWYVSTCDVRCSFSTIVVNPDDITAREAEEKGLQDHVTTIQRLAKALGCEIEDVDGQPDHDDDACDEYVRQHDALVSVHRDEHSGETVYVFVDDCPDLTA